MEGSKEDLRVVPELYFLIAKFLSGGPLKETAKTLLRELETVEVLPRRLDWEGGEHSQSYDELAERFSDIPWNRLAAVCKRMLELALLAPVDTATSSLSLSSTSDSKSSNEKIQARLSLLSDILVKSKPKYSIYKQDDSLTRRVFRREVGLSRTPLPPCTLFPPGMLSGLTLQRRTLGHLSAVYCLAFDCTGRYVVTGADDLLVKVWSARDGRLLATLRGAGAEITDICISSDGALLAAGSVERLVRVWCLASGAPKAVLQAHGGTITAVHWAPPYRTDVRYLASTSTDGSVAFWTCSQDGQFLSQPVQFVERMRPGACHMICAAWSAGGAFLAAGSADHHVRVYAASGQGAPHRVLEMAVHCDAVDSICWAHRGLRFVSGSKDGCAALWTLHATQWRHQLLRCSSADDKKLKVTMVCWDCSDQLVMTAVSDCTVRVWCARAGTEVRILRGHRDEAYVLEPHPFLSGVLLSAGHDGQLFVWDATTGQSLAKFHNHIEGQGDGAIFDAKWGGGASVAATDSHGHLLLLGLGAGHPLLKTLPQELFFHTDYRPLVRDALGGALDEQTETPPHEMPPPFLVDVEGAPHPPRYQRLVPGREHMAKSQLVPAADRSRIDLLIEALAAERTPPGGLGVLEGRGGVWRGEGVRHTLGSWQPGPAPCSTTIPTIVRPLCSAAQQRMHGTACELNEMEMCWWRREMRRRPVMISTGAGEADRGGARRRKARRGDGRPTRPTRPQRPTRTVPSPEPYVGSSSSSSESVRSAWDRTPASGTTSHSSLDISFSGGSKSDESSSSSQYSDWEAGQPPARARRKPVPTARYSPSTSAPKRVERPERPEPPPPAAAAPPASRQTALPDNYRPGDWLTCVSPRKAPYHPQMADQLVYFKLGHQRYFEAVAEKDLFKVNPRDKPWERTHVNDCEFAKVVGIKYVIKPPRIACLRLACEKEPDASKSRTFTVKYHDMPDVIDFLVLRQQYDSAVARRWGAGDRFRCMIDDSWWTGVVVERTGGEGGSNTTEAASHFLSLKVRWDNGEVERLSPWDLEPIDTDRLPPEPGGCVPVLSHELEAVLHRPSAADWGTRGDRPEACGTIARHIAQVMTLSVAEPFVAPVDLQAYPAYAMVVAYPVDLATIKARFDNLFYRRAAAAQFDVRYLASNAELFNEPHSPIVRQARLLAELLLHIIANWSEVDVLAVYHQLAASYHSSDEDTHNNKSTASRRKPSPPLWRHQCEDIVTELIASADAEPFRQPVSIEQAPDYHIVVPNPIDLGTVQRHLSTGAYSNPEQFAADVRRVFANSRLYNTNKRSRIYSMTVRLSALFESLWSRRPRSRRVHRTPAGMSNGNSAARSASSDSEPLAVTSRRRHGRYSRHSRHTRHARHGRDHSDWDSDAPLTQHTKGKGVGKKSKARVEPVASTSAVVDPPMVEEYLDVDNSSEDRVNGFQGTESDGTDRTRIEVIECTFEDTLPGTSRRKRPRNRYSGSSAESSRPTRRRRARRPRLPREPVMSAGSSSSPSASPPPRSSPAPRRYSSDRDYRAPSSDDDAPLTAYRQRNGSELSGPRPISRPMLRARPCPRRYNEESDDDAATAISKRQPLGAHGITLARRRQRHTQGVLSMSMSRARARESMSLSVPADHTYSNGHDAPPPPPASAASAHTHTHYTRPHPHPHPLVHPHPASHAHAHTEHNSEDDAPVSISSRGRVRKLTVKARGLLRE